MGAVEWLMDWLKEKVRSAQPRPGEGNKNLGLRWLRHHCLSSSTMAGAMGTKRSLRLWKAFHKGKDRYVPLPNGLSNNCAKYGPLIVRALGCSPRPPAA